MQRVPVESSDIVSVGYDPKTRILEIEFKEGRVYQYLGVDPDTHRLFMKADSYGQYFLASINGHYRYRRIDEHDTKAEAAQTLAFVTSNAHKFRDMHHACQPLGIELAQLELPVEEIQSHDPQEVALAKAKHAYKLASRPVVVHDASWNILALRGFPGAFAQYIDDWLRPEDLLRLMEGKTDRTIICTDTLVYYDGKHSKVFSEDTRATITEQPRGKGRTLEQITIVNGEQKTVAEVYEQEDRSGRDPDNNVWRDFAKWYNLQRRLGKV